MWRNSFIWFLRLNRQSTLSQGQRLEHMDLQMFKTLSAPYTTLHKTIRQMRKRSILVNQLPRLVVTHNPERDWNKCSLSQTIWESVKKHARKEKAVGMHHCRHSEQMWSDIHNPVDTVHTRTRLSWRRNKTHPYFTEINQHLIHRPAQILSTHPHLAK